MSIKSEPYYYVVCDRCGGRADYGDFSAMSDASAAVEMLGDDGEWLTINGKDGELHYCSGCTVWSDDEDCFVPRFEPFVSVSLGGAGDDTK